MSSAKKDFDCSLNHLVPISSLIQSGIDVPLKLSLKVKTNARHMVTNQGCRLGVVNLPAFSMQTLPAQYAPDLAMDIH